MTPTVPVLLAQKQQLVKRLHEEPRLNEQDEIARLLAGINAMLNQLDEGPSKRERCGIRRGCGRQQHQPTTCPAKTFFVGWPFYPHSTHA